LAFLSVGALAGDLQILINKGCTFNLKISDNEVKRKNHYKTHLLNVTAHANIKRDRTQKQFEN
jgi:hypothetical protein